MWLKALLHTVLLYILTTLQGLVAAARIAGLQLGALINNTSAAALTYARFHEQDLAKPIMLAIIDVGHSDMQVYWWVWRVGAAQATLHSSHVGVHRKACTRHGRGCCTRVG